MNKFVTVAAAAGLVGAIALAWWWQNKSGSVAGRSSSVTAGAPGAQGAPAGAGPAGTGGRPAGPGGPGGPGGPAPVEAGKVETITLTDEVASVGSLRSRQGVMVRPESSGRIALLGFKDGERVRKGQLLLQLDDTLQKAQVQQAQAQANIARTNLARSKELLGQGFISQAAVDQNSAALEVADAQVALAQAQLARMKVLAPFDGLVGIRTVDVGDYVRDGADIVNLEDLGALTVAFRLPERTIGRLRTGQPVDITLDAIAGRSFKGRVEALDSLVDETGRALLVKAQVDNTGALLKPGMFARTRVLFSTRDGALVVPEEALVPQGARQFIFKLVEGPPGPNGPTRLAQRLEAKVGLRLPGKVEILEGLKAGDSVVTAGHARLRGESTPVRVIDLARAAAPRPPAGAGPGGAASAPRPGAAPGSAPAAAQGGSPPASAARAGTQP